MKKLFTLLFISTLFYSSLTAQVCGPTAIFNSTGRLLLGFNSEDDANYYEDTNGNGETGDCAMGATCDQLVSYTAIGDNILTAGGTEPINISSTVIKDAPGATLRSDAVNGNGSAPGSFSGTVTYTLIGGGTKVCTYVSGLPVELISFNATADDNAVTLNWKTASELNNDYFVIERSVDGRNFEEVSKEAGVGTSAVINEYRAVDNNPFTGINYYRLRQVDFDGTEDYSDMVQVKFRSDKLAGELNVYPTLVQNSSMLYVDLSENNKGITTFDVFDFNGKLVATADLENGDLASFSIDELQNGMYLLKSRNAENSVAARFVIAR